MSEGGPVAGQRTARLIPGSLNLLVELRGCWEDTPLCAGLGDAKEIKIMLGDEGTKRIVLGMRRQFRKATEILEAKAQRGVQVQAGRDTPGAVEKSGMG